MNMEVQEKMLEYVAQNMADKHADLLEAVGRKPEELKAIRTPFKRMTYADAVELAQKRGANIKMGQDIGQMKKRCSQKMKQSRYLSQTSPRQ